MSTFLRFALALHGFALAIWLAALVAAGLSAATLFPAMKSLEPSLPSFALYEGEHWRIAAGIPANNIFGIVDRIQFVCGGVALMTLGFWMSTLARLRQEGQSIAVIPALLRTVAISGAMAGLCYQLFILGPRMSIALKKWIAAASAGDTATAETFRAAFDTDHPSASRTLMFTAACVIFGLVVHLWNPPAARERPD
ncbi:MAG: hypothetical protein PSX37_03320 [bacterium]|nr:hypothetical protein [bacterium]